MVTSQLRITGAALVLLMTLAGCGGGTGQDPPTRANAQAAAMKASAAPLGSVTGMTKVSETRVSRTVFDYVFRITVRNDSGSTLTAVTATLTGVGAGASIIDGQSLVGAMAAGATVTPTDTITIRQDRVLPLDQAALVWTVNGTTPPASDGLSGAPSDNANKSIVDVDTKESYLPAEYSTDPSGNSILRTLVAIAIKQAATVQQVNTMLARISGRIAYSSAGTGVIHVRVPDPLSIGALNALITEISSDPAVEFVLETVVPSMDQLPSSATPLSRLRHHLAVRGSAAWNARAAVPMTNGPELLISDEFGGGIPNADSSVSFLNDAEIGTTLPKQHGYHVLGIIAGSFGGAGNRGDVTGMYPGPALLKTTVMDLTRLAPPFEARLASDIRLRVAAGARLVVNTSWNNWRLKTANDDRYSTIWAEYWARLIRGVDNQAIRSTIETKYMHAGSAGNIDPTMASRMAFHNSAWNAATLPARVGPALERFNNTLVVENRLGTELASKEYLPGCTLAASSFTGGNLSAIGSWDGEAGIWSFIDSALGAGERSGTSMATPQVAGLAAYLWAIRSDLNSSEVADTIRMNIHDGIKSCADSPVIDAYAATLALDQTAGLAAPTAETLPTRLAILDVVGNDRKFSIADFIAYLDSLFPVSPPGDADFSRYDLNGDGFTGGARTARFNLDVDYEAGGRASKYGVISMAPNGAVLRKANGMPLNEAALTDFEILCYYANSNLFTGTLAEIDTALATKSAALGRVVSCSERILVLNVNATNPNWTGLPATIRLSNFVARFPATSAGNSATCTNQGEPPGERGVPFFSAQVPVGVPIYAAIDVAGVPNPLSGGVSNRRNCSSFVAVSGTQVWINATGRAVFGFGGSVVSDWEYQVRYSNGSSTGAGKQCVIGNVPGSGIFAPAFSDPSCTHLDTVRITD